MALLDSMWNWTRGGVNRHEEMLNTEGSFGSERCNIKYGNIIMLDNLKNFIQYAYLVMKKIR